MNNRAVTLFEQVVPDDLKIEYEFGFGAPSVETLKAAAAIMHKGAQARLTQEAQSSTAGLMQYGATSGDPRYLAALQLFLQTEYKDTVLYENLVATCGASSGLFYTLSIMFPNKCVVFCEDTTYMIGAASLRSLGYDVRTVPMESDGLDLVSLAEQLHNMKGTCTGDNKDSPFTCALYLVPTFHNPTGRTLSPEKSERLVDFVRKERMLVLCDDVYNLLYYTGDAPPKRLFAYDTPLVTDYRSDTNYVGNIISNGSFSKYLCPGIRLGWMEVPVWFKQIWDVNPVIRSGGCLNMMVCGLVAAALEMGEPQRLLHQLRAEYKERMNAVCNLFNEILPDSCSFQVPQGGYFVWVVLPHKIRSTELLAHCQKHLALNFMCGHRFHAGPAPDDHSGHCIRLCISYNDTQRLLKGMKLLCEAIKHRL